MVKRPVMVTAEVVVVIVLPLAVQVPPTPKVPPIDVLPADVVKFPVIEVEPTVVNIPELANESAPVNVVVFCAVEKSPVPVIEVAPVTAIVDPAVVPPLKVPADFVIPALKVFDPVVEV
jgi:hypothetical protein